MRGHIKESQNPEAKSGFTILEVTLVSAAIALLLIAIAIILVNISALYQKGLTLKSINEVGRNLVTEFTTTLNSAPSIDTVSLCNGNETCRRNGAFNYIFQDVEGNYRDSVENSVKQVQYGGVFCTGEYSYVWNTHYGRYSDSASENKTLSIKYGENSILSHRNDPEENPFKIVRFKDPIYLACRKELNADNTTVDISHLPNGQPNTITESDFEFGFIDTTEVNNLDIYEFVIFPPAQDSITLRSLFAGTFILGTERGNANITRSGDYCDITNTKEGSESGEKDDGSSNLQDLGSNFNYCGINKFNFAARTAGNGV